jgi:hypothetical protein
MADSFEQVVERALRLSALERVRLVEQVAGSLEQEVTPRRPRKSLYGLWADVSVSAEDIDQARREMWGNFPRDDI